MKKFRDRKNINLTQGNHMPLPSRYESGDYHLVRVFVEGYDDVAFWRGIFDDYETDLLKFEISVPTREDLAKGKRVLMSMLPQCNPNMIVCMDSDFDYIFNDFNEQSQLVNNSEFLFHTYAYSAENYLCYPPSLHKICAKATKNDRLIFDFEKFIAAYSRTIYPLFLWYAYSARRKSEHAFSLIDFRSSVRLNYVDASDNGVSTIGWLDRQVQKRLHSLHSQHPEWIDDIDEFGRQIKKFGLEPNNVYLFMQGHTLMDNVIMILLTAVCEKLRDMVSRRISEGTKQGVALRNELSNYNNSLRNVREVLLDNEHYKDCFLYARLKTDIDRYINKYFASTATK